PPARRPRGSPAPVTPVRIARALAGRALRAPSRATEIHRAPAGGAGYPRRAASRPRRLSAPQPTPTATAFLRAFGSSLGDHAKVSASRRWAPLRAPMAARRAGPAGAVAIASPLATS